MSRQHIDYTVVGSTTDTGEEDNLAIRPIADGEPGNAATFKRPSENLRTRTEAVRSSIDNLNFLSDLDRAFLLTGTGSLTWAGLPTGTFTLDANIVLKPFVSPAASSASRLIIGSGTASQITIRTRQNGATGQPRAYNGANTISFDFTPVDTGTGVVVITVDGTPANNFHVQYDSNVTSGTTVTQMLNYLNNVTVTTGGAAFVSAGLEAVVNGTGSPVEVGFPTPPSPLVGNKVIISGPEQAFRYMAGAADAEQHIITPAQVVTFFGDSLNQLIEGDVMCLRYDALVMNANGGRLQSINESPENKASLAGLNLFLIRRFPERLPGALPIAAVVNGVLLLINNRSYASGEAGPVVTAGASYQGSNAPPNSWADGTAVSGPISFETALDTIIQTLGTKAGGTPGAIKIGFTPSGNISSNNVKTAIEELDSEKAGLALANTFTRQQTISASVAAESGMVATGNTTGAGMKGQGGATNGSGMEGTGGGTTGVGGKFTGTATGAAVQLVPSGANVALTAGNGKISAIASPGTGTDAANKNYVDASTSAFSATIAANNLWASIVPPMANAKTTESAFIDAGDFVAYDSSVGRFTAAGTGRFFIGGSLSGTPTLLYTDDCGGSINNTAASSYGTAMSGNQPLAMAINAAHSLAVSTGNSGGLASAPAPFTSWTARTSGVVTSLTDVSWNDVDGEWVAAGASGVVLTSPTGVTWTTSPPGLGVANIHVAYDPNFGITMAASDESANDSALAKSPLPSGLFWTVCHFTPWTSTNTIKQLDYINFGSGGCFIVVTARGGVYTSDGSTTTPTWTTIVSPDAGNIGYSGTKAVFNGTYAIVSVYRTDSVQNFSVVLSSATTAAIVPGHPSTSNYVRRQQGMILGAFNSTWWNAVDSGGTGLSTGLIVRSI